MSSAAQNKKKAAILGTGHIGTDLLIKVMRISHILEAVAFVGVDAASEGLAFAKRQGVWTTSDGLQGLIDDNARFADVDVFFDATSAKAHIAHAAILARAGKKVIDLTPAALGPFVVPVVNLDAQRSAPNLNMTTCGGQATIPMVHAVSRVAEVAYAEIVASIASKSAGPGTRANIDEFTHTTARAIEQVGGAKKAKAIIILNPADPPLLMRDTVYCFVVGDVDQAAVVDSVRRMEKKVQGYVPGYRLKAEPMFDAFDWKAPGDVPVSGGKITILLEVEGAGHHLPPRAFSYFVDRVRRRDLA